MPNIHYTRYGTFYGAGGPVTGLASIQALLTLTHTRSPRLGRPNCARAWSTVLWLREKENKPPGGKYQYHCKELSKQSEGSRP